MKTPYIYDKAKYHNDTIEQYGLSEEHTANHTVVFLRWLIENDLMSDFFCREGEAILHSFRAGQATIHEVYEWRDCCLVDDMLSNQGNAFAMRYFDFNRGRYLQDYITTLKGNLPSELHIDYNEDNYQRMRVIIDRRYDEWRKRKNK